jgi:hypothetical protein
VAKSVPRSDHLAFSLLQCSPFLNLILIEAYIFLEGFYVFQIKDLLMGLAKENLKSPCKRVGVNGCVRMKPEVEVYDKV